MSLFKLLNDEDKLKEIEKVISPYKRDSAKGSKVIAMALNKWSNGKLVPVDWFVSEESSEFSGVYIMANLCGKEKELYFTPQASDKSVYITKSDLDIKNLLTSGFPRFPKRSHSLTRNNKISLAAFQEGLNKKQISNIENLVDYLNRELGSFKLDTDILIGKYETSKLVEDTYLSYSRFNKSFEFIEPVKAADEYTVSSRKVWNLGITESSWRGWPEHMNANELVDFIKNATSSPDSIYTAVFSIRLYCRENKLKLNPTQWLDIALSTFEKTDYISVPQKNAIRGIEKLPLNTQILWLDKVLDVEPFSYPEVLEYIDKLEHPFFEHEIAVSNSKNPFAKNKTQRALLLDSIATTRIQSKLETDKQYISSDIPSASAVYAIFRTKNPNIIPALPEVSAQATDQLRYMLSAQPSKQMMRRKVWYLSFVYKELSEINRSGSNDSTMRAMDNIYNTMETVINTIPRKELGLFIREAAQLIKSIETKYKEVNEDAYNYGFGGYVPPEYKQDNLYLQFKKAALTYTDEKTLTTYETLMDSKWEALAYAFDSINSEHNDALVLPELEGFNP